ncbi:hypothetical protein ABZ766_26895 [Streptomyces sp. NPDC006670]|uniref:hypothetical protein n=1 Tax=Streptomyces sp. NPDC006670 TaxID=3154476 RepID=UPI00340AE8B4
MSRQEPRAKDVLAIYRRFLAGEATPFDLRGWLDRAKAAGEPSMTESTLLLQELRGHLTARDGDPAWQEVAAHPIFRVGIYTGRGNVGIMTVAAAVAGMTVTTAVLPFLQSLAAQAGQQAFEAARASTRRLIRRNGEDAPAIHSGRQQIAVEETGTGLRFIVPPDLPDAALAALASADLEALAAPVEGGARATIHWDEASGQWRRHVTGGRAQE